MGGESPVFHGRAGLPEENSEALCSSGPDPIGGPDRPTVRRYRLFRKALASVNSFIRRRAAMMRPSTLRPFRATSTSIARTYLRCGTLSRPFMSTTPLKTINVSEEFGDHSWRQQNHIWSETEIKERMKTSDLKHVSEPL